MDLKTREHHICMCNIVYGTVHSKCEIQIIPIRNGCSFLFDFTCVLVIYFDWTFQWCPVAMRSIFCFVAYFPLVGYVDKMMSFVRALLFLLLLHFHFDRTHMPFTDYDIIILQILHGIRFRWTANKK